jgi:hypothetical protein
MARDEAPPFARGETYYNNGATGVIPVTDSFGVAYGGINLEGREYTFEVNAQDQGTGYPAGQDPTGRPIRVKVVRNISGVPLLPGRVARFEAASTSTSPFECHVDGYAYQATDVVAGIVDEFLPAAGVAPNDLFYVVFDGPTQVLTGATTVAAISPGSPLTPAFYGATQLDPLAGRVTVQGVTSAEPNNAIEQFLGYADGTAATTATNTLVPAVVHLRRW